VLAYGVAQRRYEIGIRMALGARRADVMTSILRRTLVLTLAGVLLGAAGAGLVTRTLRPFLFQVTPPIRSRSARVRCCCLARHCSRVGSPRGAPRVSSPRPC
jgi:ABC-type lipoprotein release transport system permease subunit